MPTKRIKRKRHSKRKRYTGVGYNASNPYKSVGAQIWRAPENGLNSVVLCHELNALATQTVLAGNTVAIGTLGRVNSTFDVINALNVSNPPARYARCVVLGVMYQVQVLQRLGLVNMVNQNFRYTIGFQPGGANPTTYQEVAAYKKSIQQFQGSNSTSDVPKAVLYANLSQLLGIDVEKEEQMWGTPTSAPAFDTFVCRIAINSSRPSGADEIYDCAVRIKLYVKWFQQQ